MTAKDFDAEVRPNGPGYAKNTVTSADGTTIGYRQMGTGPGLILLHGGMKSSQDFMKLAQLLSSDFTVYVPDRRGRGLSGPPGNNFSVLREVEDVQALSRETGTHNLFGLSSGTLVTLKTAQSTPAIRRAALYEPPFSIAGSVPQDWMPSYEEQLARGALASAVITALKGLGTEPLFSRLPRFVLVPLMAVIMKRQGDAEPEKVTIRSLAPTMHLDLQIAVEMSDTQQDNRGLETSLLFLHGTKSPAYFETALTALAEVLPQAQCKTLPGLGHDGPEDDGRPEVVATELRQFFREPH